MANEVEHKVRPIGTTYHYNRRKYHIIGTCMDKVKAGQMLVYLVNYYGKYKQWWHYEAISAEDYDSKYNCGLIKEA